MPKKNCFYTIENQVQSEIKIRRSTFACTLEPVASISRAKRFISEVSKTNKTATHNCWAYILGETGDLFHSSDAGEPSGTAGKPMLNALRQYELTNVAAVVTRIFGGVKLGVRGLMDAYFQSVEKTAACAQRIRLVEMTIYQVELAYDFNEIFLNQIRKFNPEIEATEYTGQIMHRFKVETDFSASVTKLLKSYRSQGQLEIIDLDKVP